MITKAIIPAAGLGTRLRPMTKYLPKELLPLGDKPIIQHIIEMYLACHVCEICIIINPDKLRLQAFLSGNFRSAAVPYQPDRSFFERFESCRKVFLVQEEPRGVADAVSLARDFVGNEPFACIMPDCVLFSDKPFLNQLIKTFVRHQKNVIGTIWIDHGDAKKYGNVGLLEGTPLDDDCFTIDALSDKADTPLHVPRSKVVRKGFGGGIYLPQYFDLIERVRPKAQGEIDDVPIHHLLIDQKQLLGVSLQGTPFDTGHPQGYRRAVHFAGRQGNRNV